MEQLYTVLGYIERILFIAYSFALVISVFQFRVVNSTVICVSVLSAMQILMLLLQQPLLDSGSQELWYGAWTFINVFIIFCLYKIHELLKVNLAEITNKVAFACLLMACVQTIRYIERQNFGGEFLDSWYYLSVNTINVYLAITVLWTVVKDKQEKQVGLYV